MTMEFGMLLLVSICLALIYMAAFAYARWKEKRDGQGKNYLLISPAMIVGMWMGRVLGKMLIYGVANGLRFAVGTSLDVLIFLCVFDCFLLCALPFLRRCFSANFCAIVWFVPLARYFRLPFIAADSLPFKPLLLYISLTMRHLYGILMVWAIGAAAVFLYQALSHAIFAGNLRRRSGEVTDEAILRRLKEAEGDGVGEVRLCRCPGLNTPLAVEAGGIRLIRAYILYLPDVDYTREELDLIFRHELCHIRRDDIGTKKFLGCCRALGWFCPFVWMSARRAGEDLELSCDESVLRMAGDAERRQYAELLLRTAGDERGYTTNLSVGAKSLRYRLRQVIHPTRRLGGALLLGALVFLCMMCSGSVAFSCGRRPVAEQIVSEDAAWKTLAEGPLAGVEAERLLTDAAYIASGTPSVTVSLSDGRYVTVTENFIAVEQVGEYPDYYALVQNIDMVQLKAQWEIQPQE